MDGDGFDYDEMCRWDALPHQDKLAYIFAALRDAELRLDLADSLTELGRDYSSPCCAIRDRAIRTFLNTPVA